MDDRVRERQILAAQLFLEDDEVCRALFVAVNRPFVGTRRESGKGDVHVVRCAAHQADAVLGADFQCGMAPDEILPRARDQMAGVDRLTGFRIGDETATGLSVLQIEHRREVLGGTA